MIRAACGVVILIPVAFGVLWAKREAAVKECVISALTRQLDGDRSLAEIIYDDGKDLDAACPKTSSPILNLQIINMESMWFVKA